MSPTLRQLFTDYGCPTNAAQADFFVNSLGELFRGSELVPELGSINLVQLARQHGVAVIPQTEEDYGYAAWEQLIADEWEARLRLCLTGAEHRFVKKVQALQEAVSGSRFRVYGEMCSLKQNPLFGDITPIEETIVLVTEFKEYTRLVDLDRWQQMKQLVTDTAAHFWIMDDGYEVEHSWRHADESCQEIISEEFGEHHGWPYAQVELSWQVAKLNPDQLRSYVRELTVQTQSLWETCGMAII